jgi:hypothetical protein
MAAALTAPAASSSCYCTLFMHLMQLITPAQPSLRNFSFGSTVSAACQPQAGAEMLLAGSDWHILPTAALRGLAAARGRTVLCSCSRESLLMQRQSRVLRLCATPFITKTPEWCWFGAIATMWPHSAQAKVCSEPSSTLLPARLCRQPPFCCCSLCCAVPGARRALHLRRSSALSDCTQLPEQSRAQRTRSNVGCTILCFLLRRPLCRSRSQACCGCALLSEQRAPHTGRHSSTGSSSKGAVSRCCMQHSGPHRWVLSATLACLNPVSLTLVCEL